LLLSLVVAVAASKTGLVEKVALIMAGTKLAIVVEQDVAAKRAATFTSQPLNVASTAAPEVAATAARANSLKDRRHEVPRRAGHPLASRSARSGSAAQ
jgi:hypothetical protein